MPHTLTSKGYLLPEDLEGTSGAPSAARRKKGPVAIFECVQNIPCNPCADSCKAQAVEVGEDITNTPSLLEDACSGCCLCVAACPGQAVFVVDESQGNDKATVAIPYEFLPLPQKGETVTALDRSGAPLGPATVVRVLTGKAMDATAVVTIEVPLEWSMTARFFRRDEQKESGNE